MLRILEKIRFFFFGEIEPLAAHPVPQEVNRIEREVRYVDSLGRKAFLLQEFFALHQRMSAQKIPFYYSVATVSEQQLGGSSDELVTLITGHHSVVIAVWGSGRVLKTRNEEGFVNLKRGVWRSLAD